MTDAGKLLDTSVSRPVGLDKASDHDLVAELQKRGHRVQLDSQEGGEGKVRIPLLADEAQKIRLAVVSDTHLGSKWQQLTSYWQFMQRVADENIDAVLHCGDIVDGSHKMHRDMPYHVFLHGFDAQLDYAEAMIPDIGIPQWMINGNHDWSFMNGDGANIAKHLAKRRDDLNWAGDLGSYVALGEVSAYIWHPPGGVAYARSYKLQKWIEQQPPTQRPELLFGGHFHVATFLPDYGGMHGWCVPCFQGQTPYIRRLGLNPVIGGYIIELGLNDEGKIQRLQQEMISFDPVDDDY